MPRKKSFEKKGTGIDRMQRVSDLMHRSIAKLLREEFKDPRIGMVTISSVEVSRDLAHAKVYITVLQESKIKETIDILNEASGFFRGHLARTLNLRLVPKPRFIFDESVMRGSHIESLLASVHDKNRSNEDNEANDNRADSENNDDSEDNENER